MGLWTQSDRWHVEDLCRTVGLRRGGSQVTDQPEGERRRSALRRKLPELLVEGFSVALAVLLALAVDEWRENRSNLELAQRAEASIMAEVGSNRSRLE